MLGADEIATMPFENAGRAPTLGRAGGAAADTATATTAPTAADWSLGQTSGVDFTDAVEPEPSLYDIKMREDRKAYFSTPDTDSFARHRSEPAAYAHRGGGGCVAASGGGGAAAAAAEQGRGVAAATDPTGMPDASPTNAFVDRPLEPVAGQKRDRLDG